jgi:CheY-like chemotaxis protein
MSMLVVEDNPTDVLIMKKAIAQAQAAVDIQVVHDGEEALDYLRSRYATSAAGGVPDLIVADLNMPRMDGREFLRALKDDENLRLLPVVILTTSTRQEDVLESYRLGAASFITKPAKFEDFVNTLTRLIAYWCDVVTLPSSGGQ